MRQSAEDWLTVVDSRGRFMAAVGLVLAFGVSLIEIVGAGIVALSIQLATGGESDPVTIPLLGDVEALLPGSTRAADLRWMAALGSLFFVVRGFAVLLQQYVIYRSSFSLAVRLTDRVTERLLGREYEWHLSQNSAELSSVSVGVCQFFATKVFTPLQLAGSQALVVLGLATVGVAVEPIGALTAVVAIGAVIALSLRETRKRLLPLSEIEVEELGHGQRLTTEAFQAIREVKILGLDVPVRQRIKASRSRWARALRQISVIVSAPRTVIETIAFASLITLVAYRSQTDGPSALAGLGVIGYAVIRILPTANNMITHVNTVRSGSASMDRLADILRGERDGGPSLGREVAGRSCGLPLEATEVRFAHAAGDEVLAGIDVRIDPGASIGLVGTTGCGKSTLLDVLTGLLVPTAGEITLDGVPLLQCRELWWRQIGIVPQSITLFDASLAENVALGVVDDEIHQASLWRAIRYAQLEAVVEELPEGIDTQIGERGVRLSGGQRQRVAIARALYRDPAVIFLDEGTSALDAETEEAVVAGLRAGRPDRTLVMVAHRVSTLRDCDEILLLDAGRVISRGTHEQLMATDHRFRRLAAAVRD